MAQFLHPVYGVAYFALIAWGIRLNSRRSSFGLLIVLLTALGLVYDNATVALGNSLGIGQTLHDLSVPRFVIHALLTPALLIPVYGFGVRLGIFQPSTRNKLIIGGLVVGLVALGVGTSLVNMHLYPVCQEGNLRYSERVADTQMCEGYAYPPDVVGARGIPPIPSIAMVFGIGAMAFVISRKTGWHLLVIGAVLMIFAAAVPISRVGLWISNGGEVLLVAALIATEAFVQRREAAPQMAPARATAV